MTSAKDSTTKALSYDTVKWIAGIAMSLVLFLVGGVATRFLEEQDFRQMREAIVIHDKKHGHEGMMRQADQNTASIQILNNLVQSSNERQVAFQSEVTTKLDAMDQRLARIERKLDR
jgi:hypothetical protein